MTNKTNILCLLLDTARTDNLSIYDGERSNMPYLSELVEEKELLKVEKCYSTSIWSLPVYGSFFTGKLPNEHGAVDWDSSIEVNTLNRKLSEEGYYSKAISTHLISGGFGIGQGFDDVEFIGDAGFSDPVFEEFSKRSSKGEYETEIEKYLGFLKILAKNPNPNSVLNSLKFFRGKLNSQEDKGADDVVDQIKNFDFTRKPYFLFANFVEPHFPHELPGEMLEDTDLTQKDLDEINDIDKRRATVGDLEIDEKTRQKMLKAHDLELKYLDTKIEEIIQHLKEEDEYENTNIVIFADHGDVFGEKNVWEHMGAITEGLIHVPLLIKPAKNLDIEKPDFPVSIIQLHDYLKSIATGEDFEFEEKPIFTEYYGMSSQSDIDPAEDFGADSEYWNRYQCAVTDWPYRLIWDSQGNRDLINLDKNEKLKISSNQEILDKLQDQMLNQIGDSEKIRRNYSENKILDSSIDI